MAKTVNYEEIENRLAICCEFLLDRNRPIKNAYNSLMGKVGMKLMEYSEFEYWFRRFQNNQFDLGYDTSLDEKEIQKTEVPKAASGRKDVPAVVTNKKKSKKVVEDSKINNQFNEKNVPRIFQTLINRRSEKLKKIEVCLTEKYCNIKLDEIRIRLINRRNEWMIRYASRNTVIETDDPEKSIIDHLWFVLKNPNIKLEDFSICHYKNQESKLNNSQKLDFEKIDTLLQSMFNSINHQIHTNLLSFEGFNEDTFLSMLKHLKPGTLETIVLNTSWKEKGNDLKMEEIVETDQWKQAKRIASLGVTPLKVDDLFQCERFCLKFDSVSPKDVLRLTEHVFNSTDKKCCTLSSNNKKLDINSIIDFLRSQNDGLEIFECGPLERYKICYVIMKFKEIVFLCCGENEILIQKY